MATSVYKWLAILFSGLTLLNHPLHVSVIQADWNEKEHAIEMSCKFFREDLEQAIGNTTKAKVDLEDSSLHEDMDQLVGRYMKEHLQLTVNGQKTTLGYLGYEIDNESLYTYVQVSKQPDIKNLGFSNTLLYDLFTDQINIMHVKKGETRHSVRLNYPDKEISVSF